MLARCGVLLCWLICPAELEWECDEWGCCCALARRCARAWVLASEAVGPPYDDDVLSCPVLPCQLLPALPLCCRRTACWWAGEADGNADNSAAIPEGGAPLELPRKDSGTGDAAMMADTRAVTEVASASAAAPELLGMPPAAGEGICRTGDMPANVLEEVCLIVRGMGDAAYKASKRRCKSEVRLLLLLAAAPAEARWPTDTDDDELGFGVVCKGLFGLERKLLTPLRAELPVFASGLAEALSDAVACWFAADCDVLRRR